MSAAIAPQPRSSPPTVAGDWPASRSVERPDAVALLTDLKALRYLMPFTTTSHTLSSAAAAIGKPVSTIAYWIPKFVRAGLLDHLGVVRRAGMPMPLYRAVARRITVPLRAIPIDRRVALLDGGRNRLLRRFIDGIDEAMQDSDAVALGFAGVDGGGLSIEMIEPPEDPARGYTDGWTAVHLDDAAAIAFARDLEALVERYGAMTGPKKYIVHVGLAPEPRFRWRSAADDVLG